MILRKLGLALIVGTAAALASGSALAYRSHVHFGLYLGVPAWGPAYYPAPYSPYYYYPPYYYPPTVVVPASPPTYVEQQPVPQASQASGYWYYCTQSRSYYPYVKDCPGGWERVSPQPPAN